VNPHADEWVTAIVRSALLDNAVQADEAFVADSNMFSQHGIVVEMDSKDARANARGLREADRR